MCKIKWRLKIVMAERDITGKDLAEKTGMNPQTLWRMARAKAMPRLEEGTLLKLCQELKCQPGDLLRLEECE